MGMTQLRGITAFVSSTRPDVFGGAMLQQENVPEGFTQFGEDQILSMVFAPDFKGYAMDIGAANGITRSNTYGLEQAGWTVLCVEANPLYTEMLQLKRKLVRMVAVADYEGSAEFTAFELSPGMWEAASALKPAQLAVDAHKHRIQKEYKFNVKVTTLDRLLEDCAFPQLDFISIDVEGGEMEVLKCFDVGRWKPKVIILENWLVEDTRQREFLRPFGYNLLQRLGVNDIYVAA